MYELYAALPSCADGMQMHDMQTQPWSVMRYDFAVPLCIVHAASCSGSGQYMAACVSCVQLLIAVLVTCRGKHD